MTHWIDRAERLLSNHAGVVRVTLVEATGPSPRDVGAGALVTSETCDGRIGRGELQTTAIDVARRMLGGNAPASPHAPPRWLRSIGSYPMGPVLGTSSGGVKTLLFELVTLAELRAMTATGPPDIHHAVHVDRSKLGGWFLLRPLGSGTPAQLVQPNTGDTALPKPAAMAMAALRTSVELTCALSGDVRTSSAERWLAERLTPPTVPFYVYGTGLLARALVRALSGLPFEVVWIDEDLRRFPASPPANVTLLASDHQATLAREAPPGAYHAVMSVSHDLDFAIVRAALEAGNFGYLGVIGSRMKRKRLHARLTECGIPAERLARLVCPIGLAGISSKTPAVIAISIAAQALRTLQAQQLGERQDGMTA